MASDQRYCLECGERRTPMSSVLLDRPAGPSAASAPPARPQQPPPVASRPGQPGSGALTVIAGVGVLLLALGIGVLIGRSGATKTVTEPSQVISVAQSPAAAGAPAQGSGEATFSDDWPAGKSGFTVQLQTLPSTTAVAAVQAAKTAATGKGAKGVGALRSKDFSSVSSSGYVIYSGVYGKRAEAQGALAGLRKSFPGAKVVEVSNKSSSAGSSSKAGASGGGGSGGGGSLSHPAPPSSVKSLQKAKGKSYEEKSKNLPDVIQTG